MTGCGSSADVANDPITGNKADAGISYADSWVDNDWSYQGYPDAQTFVVVTDAGIDDDPNDPPIDAYIVVDAVPPECQTNDDCNDDRPCTLDSCDAEGTCQHEALTGLACNDGDLCTHSDVCLGDGQCKGTAISCQNDPGTCGVKRVCDGTPSCKVTVPGVNVACDDGNKCTAGDKCDGGGKCIGTLLTGWQRAATIERVQSDPDGHWSQEQTKTWTVDRPITGLRVHGYSDDGGYCFAHWGDGHIAKYRHDGSFGLYNVDDRYYNICFSWQEGCDADLTPCPTYPPHFGNDGTVRVCQYTSDAGNLDLGTGSTNNPPAIGSTVTVKARHTIGKSIDQIKCYMDYKCD